MKKVVMKWDKYNGPAPRGAKTTAAFHSNDPHPLAQATSFRIQETEHECEVFVEAMLVNSVWMDVAVAELDMGGLHPNHAILEPMYFSNADEDISHIRGGGKLEYGRHRDGWLRRV